jgi:hypothetical protein
MAELLIEMPRNQRHADPLRTCLMRNTVVFQLAFFISIAVFTSVMAVNLFVYLEFGTFEFESGEFRADRMLVHAIQRTYMEYGPVFLDPISRQAPVFYQFSFYWLTGAMAKFLNMDPWVFSNALNVLITPAFFLVTYWTCKTISGSRWIALMATCLTLSFGHLEFLLTRDLYGDRVHGQQAAIFSFARGLYSFSADTYSLFFGYIGLGAIWKLSHSDKASPACAWRDGAVFLAAWSIAALFHLLVAMFFVLLYSAILAAAYVRSSRWPRMETWRAVSLALVFAVCLAFSGWRPPMWVFALFGAAVVGRIMWKDPSTRIIWCLIMIGLVPQLALTAANLATIAQTGGRPFYYNEVVRTLDLAIPFWVVLVSYFPLIALSWIAVTKLSNQGLKTDLQAICVAMLAAVFNHVLGYNNHPYRFLPFSMPMLCLVASIGAEVLLRERTYPKMRVVAGCVLLGLIVLGIVQNACTYSRIAWTTPSRKDPRVDPLVRVIEEIRSAHPDDVFLPQFLTMHWFQLAPYCGARFAIGSGLGAEPSHRDVFTPEVVEMLHHPAIQRAIVAKLSKVRWVLTDFPLPQDEGAQSVILLDCEVNGAFVYRVVPDKRRE